TYVDDAVEATAKAGLVPEAEGGVFNIGTDRETSIRELAEIMRRLYGSQVPIVSVPQEAVYGKSYEDVSRRVPDVTRMNTILGLTAKVDLEDGLTRTIAWFRSPEASEAAGIAPVEKTAAEPPKLAYVEPAGTRRRI